MIAFMQSIKRYLTSLPTPDSVREQVARSKHLLGRHKLLQWLRHSQHQARQFEKLEDQVIERKGEVDKVIFRSKSLHRLQPILSTLRSEPLPQLDDEQEGIRRAIAELELKLKNSTHEEQVLKRMLQERKNEALLSNRKLKLAEEIMAMAMKAKEAAIKDHPSRMKFKVQMDGKDAAIQGEQKSIMQAVQRQEQLVEQLTIAEAIHAELIKHHKELTQKDCRRSKKSTAAASAEALRQLSQQAQLLEAKLAALTAREQSFIDSLVRLRCNGLAHFQENLAQSQRNLQSVKKTLESLRRQREGKAQSLQQLRKDYQGELVREQWALNEQSEGRGRQASLEFQLQLKRLREEEQELLELRNVSCFYIQQATRTEHELLLP